MQQPLVIQTEELSEHAAAYVAKHARLEVAHFSTPRFEELLPDAHALVVRTYTTVDEAMLSRAPHLRVVGRAGVGLDRIDVAACEKRGVRVVHTPDANSQAVAELVFALLHDATRPRLFLDSSLASPEWNALRKELTAPRQLNELTFGVLGLGRIGTRVARIAGAYGAKVLFHDLLTFEPARCAGATPVSLDELLRQSDVVTLHIDPRPANHKFVSTEFISKLKPDVILINSARGVLVDAAALAEFLRSSPKARALLDVHDPEPFTSDYPLLGLANAHLSPHIAAATAAAHENMSMVVVDVIAALNEQQTGL